MSAIARHQPSELPEWPLLTLLPLVRIERLDWSGLSAMTARTSPGLAQRDVPTTHSGGPQAKASRIARG